MNMIDYIFNPPKLQEHRCDLIKGEYSFLGIRVAKFPNTEWFIIQDDSVIKPILLCPYCGVKLEQ